MSAAQQFLELYPDAWEDFADLRSEIMQAMFPDLYAEAEEELDVVQDGNVYTLNKWSKTKGSA
jgi:hypothetical protein